MKKGETRTFVREGIEYVIAHGTHAQRHLHGDAVLLGRILQNDDDRAPGNFNMSYAMAFREYPDVMA